MQYISILTRMLFCVLASFQVRSSKEALLDWSPREHKYVLDSQNPGRWRRREETGRSRNRRNHGHQVQVADQQWWSRCWRSPEWRRRDNEPGDAEPPGSQSYPLGSEPTPGWIWGLSLSHCWTGKREPTQGWMGPAGSKERGQVDFHLCFPV